MRIGLTYDLQHDPHDERQAEFDPPRTLEALCQALSGLGHQVVRLGAAQELLAATDRLSAVELVFNLAEGSRGRCREAWVPMLLEVLKVPYVGSDALALSVGLDKVACKRLAVAHGIPTPPWTVITHPDRLPAQIPVRFPAIVKPRYEGSGIGIDEGAIVSNRTELAQRARWLFARWPEEMLIEEMVPHGELTVCVIGNDPPTETALSSLSRECRDAVAARPTAYPAIQRPLDPRSRLSCHVARAATGPWETPLVLNESLEAQARRIALTLFEALGCADVARVDLRVDEQGKVWFLEINPLPSFDPEGSFGLLAEHAGLSYPQIIDRILQAAIRRLRLREPASATRWSPPGIRLCCRGRHRAEAGAPCGGG